MFTSKIREIMDEKSVTVRVLRDKTGLSVTTIQRAVSDDTIHKCELGTLGKIGTALSVSTKDLYDEAKPTKKNGENHE